VPTGRPSPDVLHRSAVDRVLKLVPSVYEAVASGRDVAGISRDVEECTVRAPKEREEALARHPVRWSLVLGGAWGLFMGLASIITAPLTGARFSVTFNLVFWLAAGLLIFGPWMVYGTRRRVRRRQGE
jgi:hypothetical protein